MGGKVSREGPDPIDAMVGANVRLLRKALGISQEKLAEKLGLTFQQVQKYERGSNRVSASKLWHMSQFLNAPIQAFFEGADSASNPSISGASGEIIKALVEPHVSETLTIMAGMTNDQRRIIREVAAAMTGAPVRDAPEPEPVKVKRPKSPGEIIQDLARNADKGSLVSFPFGTFDSPKAADTIARQVGGAGWYWIETTARGTKITKIADPKA